MSTDSNWSVVLVPLLQVLNCYIQAVGVAKGLRYLHSLHIIHGDLKGVSFLHLSATIERHLIIMQSNVLIGDNCEPLLCDFGRSRIIGSRGQSAEGSAGYLVTYVLFHSFRFYYPRTGYSRLPGSRAHMYHGKSCCGRRRRFTNRQGDLQ